MVHFLCSEEILNHTFSSLGCTFFSFWCSSENWTEDLMHATQELYHWATCPDQVTSFSLSFSFCPMIAPKGWLPALSDPAPPCHHLCPVINTECYLDAIIHQRTPWVLLHPANTLPSPHTHTHTHTHHVTRGANVTNIWDSLPSM
jgi:hypothetical protein